MVRLSAETEALVDRADKAIAVSEALMVERARLHAVAEIWLWNSTAEKEAPGDHQPVSWHDD
ncbi:hypothetical protein Q2941_40845 [Bradyrhizobium sp. UFLA05-153]